MTNGRRTTRKRTYKRPRRRFKRRIRRNRRTRSTISKMPTTIVPDRLITKVRVTDTMYMNSFHIPDSTTTNDQFSYQDLLLTVGNPYSVYGLVTDDVPAGLKTWANFYNEVATIYAKVKVTPLTWFSGHQSVARSGAGMPYSVCLCPIQVGNAISSSTIDFMEQPYARYKFFTQTASYSQVTAKLGATDQFYYSAQSGNSVERSVVNAMSSKKILSYKDIMDYDADPPLWISTVAPQATSPWGFVLTVKSSIPWNGQVGQEPSFTLPGLYIRIDVTYTLMFRGRKTIADDV